MSTIIRNSEMCHFERERSNWLIIFNLRKCKYHKATKIVAKQCKNEQKSGFFSEKCAGNGQEMIKIGRKTCCFALKNAKNTAKTELYIYAFSVSNTKDFHVIQDAVLPFDHEKRAFLALRTARKVHFVSFFEPLLPCF